MALTLGFWGADAATRSHAAALAQEDGVRLTGLYDTDADQAWARARNLGVLPCASPEDLIGCAEVICIGGCASERGQAARHVVEAGRHAFLAWPPTVSVPEADALARRAEEANVEVGVARALPTQRLLSACPASWSATLITLRITGPTGAPGGVPWPHALAGALDTAAALAGTREVQRLDGQADRTNGHFRSVAFSVRFRSGAYAQAAFRTAPDAAPGFQVQAAGPGAHVSAHRLSGPLCIERDGERPLAVSAGPSDELVHFVRALHQHRPPPLSVLDARNTLRLMERLMERLR